MRGLLRELETANDKFTSEGEKSQTNKSSRIPRRTLDISSSISKQQNDNELDSLRKKLTSVEHKLKVKSENWLHQ